MTDEMHNHRPESLQWQDVVRVHVFKRDCWAYDLICLAIHRTDGDVVEFDEEDPAWEALMIALPRHLPGCRPQADWFTDVAFPAFTTNLQTLYERPVAADA